MWPRAKDTDQYKTPVRERAVADEQNRPTEILRLKTWGLEIHGK